MCFCLAPPLPSYKSFLAPAHVLSPVSGVICYRCRLALGFCRFLWLRNSGWPRQAFSPFFTALAASRHDGACGGAPSTDGVPPVVLMLEYKRACDEQEEWTFGSGHDHRSWAFRAGR